MTALAALVSATSDPPVVTVLLAFAVVLGVGRLMGAAFVRLGQPVVIGEIVAGIALGPSLLGLIPGDLHERLFPPEVLPYLTVVSKLGIVLFMFVIGLELDMTVVRTSGRRAVAISLSSVTLPFVLGSTLLAPALFDRYPTAPGTDGDAHGLTPFALFVGVSMCGSAFAILARILSERDMFKIPLGATLVACAAIDDVVVFTLLAITTSVARGGGLGGLAVTVVLLVGIIAALVVVVRPFVKRLVLVPFAREGRLGAEPMAIVFLFLMLTSWATAAIGVSELIGAFLFGAVMPRPDSGAPDEPGLFATIAGRVEGVSVQLLLPVFFVVAGQGVALNGLGLHDLVPAVAVVLVASIGKFVGGATAARLTGLPRRQALGVGALLNTRGLAELVVLGLARDLGMIGPEVYTMLVVMAVLTTVVSGPLLRLVYPDKALRRDIAEAERNRSGRATDRALVLVDHPETAAPLVDLAIRFGGARPTSSVTLVHFTDPSGGFSSVADALAPLGELRLACEAAGVPCTVVCRPSERPCDDLVAEIRRLSPDAVIASADGNSLGGLVTAAGSDLVMMHGPVDVTSGLTAPGGSSRDDRAALELAVRLALHGDATLEVAPMHRRLHRQLRSLGVAMGTGQLHVTTTSGTGTLRVQAGDCDRVGLYERLGPWRLGDVVTPLSSR